MEILVKDLFEKNTNFVLTYEDAKVLYEEMKNLLSKHEVITLDFSGLKIVSSSFLSGSIGLLVKEMTVENIKQKIILKNTPLGTMEIFNMVLNNAEKFYKNN